MGFRFGIPPSGLRAHSRRAGRPQARPKLRPKPVSILRMTSVPARCSQDGSGGNGADAGRGCLLIVDRQDLSASRDKLRRVGSELCYVLASRGSHSGHHPEVTLVRPPRRGPTRSGFVGHGADDWARLIGQSARGHPARLQLPHRARDGPDVRRSGAAASAHEGCPAGDELPGGLREVLGVACVAQRWRPSACGHPGVGALDADPAACIPRRASATTSCRTAGPTVRIPRRSPRCAARRARPAASPRFLAAKSPAIIARR